MAAKLIPEKASPKAMLYKAYAAYKAAILKRAANRERVYLLPFDLWADPLSGINNGAAGC
jgi:hypothetical protein